MSNEATGTTETVAPAATDAQPKPAEAAAAQTPAAAATEVRAEEVDWHKAYQTLKRTHDDLVVKTKRSDALVDTLLDQQKSLSAKVDQLYVRDLPPDEASRYTAEQEAKRRDEQNRLVMESVQAQGRLLLRTLEAYGIRPDDPDLVWPDAKLPPKEWFAEAEKAVTGRVSKERSRLLDASEKAIAHAKTEADKQVDERARKKLKDEAGVGVIDTAKGSARSALQRLNELDPKSKEFQELIKQASAGKLRST